jgi:hypothetical protein
MHYEVLTEYTEHDLKKEPPQGTEIIDYTGS